MKMTVSTRICNDRYVMRTVEMNDAETLRVWKNEHKDFFFLKRDITSEEQLIWMQALIEKDHDHMFMVEDNNKKIGCIGARLYNNDVDIYNVILGDKQYQGQHVMKNALWALSALCNLIYLNKKQIVRVLSNNPAIEWYKKIGFYIIDSHDDHVVMKYGKSNISVTYRFNLNITLPIY